MRSSFLVVSAVCVLGLLTVGLLTGCGAGSGTPGEVGITGIGNGMPSGPHYNLNIIGVKNSHDVGDSQGHTLFVRQNGHTKILMSQNQDGSFEITDRDGSDGVASFNIGDSDPTDGRTHYLVYARALGKPNGEVTITPNATFEDQSGDVYFYLGEITIKRMHGQPQTKDLTQMFYVDVTIDDGTTVTNYTHEWVFDIDELLEYWWDYNNSGLKLLQVRFYED